MPLIYRVRLTGTELNTEGVEKLRSNFKPFVYEISGKCGGPCYFPRPLPNYPCHVSFRRQLPLSLEVAEKPNRCKNVVGPIFGKYDPTFLDRLLARFTIHLLAKFG